MRGTLCPVPAGPPLPSQGLTSCRAPCASGGFAQPWGAATWPVCFRNARWELGSDLWLETGRPELQTGHWTNFPQAWRPPGRGLCG